MLPARFTACLHPPHRGTPLLRPFHAILPYTGRRMLPTGVTLHLANWFPTFCAHCTLYHLAAFTPRALLHMATHRLVPYRKHLPTTVAPRQVPHLPVVACGFPDRRMYTLHTGYLYNLFIPSDTMSRTHAGFTCLPAARTRLGQGSSVQLWTGLLPTCNLRGSDFF